MAIKVVSCSPNIEAVEMLADASTSFTKGSLVYRDTSTGEIKEVTATTGDATNIEGLATKTETTGATEPYIRIYPVHLGMYVTVDCTNATAANQLNKAHLWTDARTLNNTSTHSTDVNATFVALRMVGATTDNKLYGYIVKVGQVSA